MQNKRGQAEAINHQRLRGELAVLGGELAALKQHRNQGHGDRDQGGGGRHGHRQGEFARAAEGVTAPVLIPRAQTARQIGQQDHANGNPDHPKGQLIQAVRIVQPTNRALKKAGNLTAHQQVDLHHPTGQRGRRGDACQSAQLGRHVRAGGDQAEPRARRRDPEQRHLRHARNRHGPCQCQARVPTGRAPDPQRADKQHVQQNRRGGGGGKPPRGVQNTRQKRGNRNEQYIGKRDPPERDGQIEPLIPRKA